MVHIKILRNFDLSGGPILVMTLQLFVEIFVQDFNLDCSNYESLNNPRARLELLKLKDTHNLQDPWRICHPNVKRYTWSRRNLFK